MKILALIPARGGSKRLPGKNIKPLGGLPLIAWTIRAAKTSNCCLDVLVSTDSQAIADISLAYGASVPWIRPSELATDEASSVDVALHALNAYEKSHGPVDGVLLLQPTSPFRTAETIKTGVALFESSQGIRPVVGLSPAQSHPAWCFRSTSDGMSPFLGWNVLSKRSQDLEPAWILNGAFYLISSDRLRKENSFLTSDTLPLLMDDPILGIDIDTASDFEKCERTLSLKLP
jgi:CMP-N,N'-diacetyllegionaminic acid synthase